MAPSTAEISGNTFIGNRAERGSAVEIFSAVTLVMMNNTMTQNSVTGCDAAGGTLSGTAVVDRGAFEAAPAPLVLSIVEVPTLQQALIVTLASVMLLAGALRLNRRGG